MCVRVRVCVCAFTYKYNEDLSLFVKVHTLILEYAQKTMDALEVEVLEFSLLSGICSLALQLYADDTGLVHYYLCSVSLGCIDTHESEYCSCLLNLNPAKVQSFAGLLSVHTFLRQYRPS